MRDPNIQEPSRGGTILTLGILSLVICAILGPFAWVMGKRDLEKIKSGKMDHSEQSMVQGGMVCGIISSVLLLSMLLFGIIWIILFFVGYMAVGAT